MDDAASAAAYNDGVEFKDAVKQANEYAYDANGNLTKDLNKNISNIQYNFLNLPSKVTFGDGSTITYTYAADGTKLRTVHKSGSTTITTDYCGNVIYENGVQKLLLTEEGYVTLADKKYHYYLKDHQGNNRVVIDQVGNVEEVNDYYPFGGLFANADGVQPYKYNGKELDTTKDLNLYDYGARMYDPTLGRFTTMDRFAEKYYHLSPYAYAGNNPVRNIDVNGDSIIIAPNPNGMVDQIKMFFGMDTKYQSQVKNDLAQLKKDDKSIGDMITTLERSSNIHKITMPIYSIYNATSVNRKTAERNISQGTTVYYNPFNKRTKTGNVRTPRVGLVHELQHSFDADAGTFSYETTENGIYLMDVKAVNTENKIRKIIGEPKRTEYANQKIPEELLE